MTSIGRVTASAISAVSDITLAAASINFDFSLVKVGAPQEFQALGKDLSHDRRREAEDGASHATARKLGALFGPLIERTPHLIKAYGTRASEIASDPRINPKGSRQTHGLFSKQVGADGTSIWAAATSGHSAIGVHLLACMLARIWEPDEAVSIWAEIVRERQTEIQEDDGASDLEKFARDAAARQPITREDLAHWDASARSWLRCADEAKGIKVKQTQLLLILKNMVIPVNTDKTTYRSVLHAWKTAMSLAENLVAGQPQEAHDGAIILGLSAWHLFPDLVVVRQTTTTIKQGDPLIAGGGILTLGLTERPSSSETCGVSWSLPLAALNFYGDPITSTQSLDPEKPRLTADELSIVALGSVLAKWHPESHECAQAAECLVEMWSFLARHPNGIPSRRSPDNTFFNRRPMHWLKLLADAAHFFLKADGVAKERNHRLLQLGRRQARTFLQHDMKTHFLGLLSSRRLISTVKGVEAKIAILRQWISQFSVDANDVVIQYSIHEDAEESSASNWHHIEYATAVELDRRPLKHDRSGNDIPRKYHQRWIAINSHLPQSRPSAKDCDCLTVTLAACECPLHYCKTSLGRNRRWDTARKQRRIAQLSSTGESISTEEQRIFRNDVYAYEVDEHVQNMFGEQLLWHGSPKSEDTDSQTCGRLYDKVWGRTDDAAIFVACQGDRSDTLPLWQSEDGVLPLWTQALKADVIRFEAVRDLLWAEVIQSQEYFSSLDALSMAVELYRYLPGATIDPRLTANPINSTCWYQSLPKSRPESPECSHGASHSPNSDCRRNVWKYLNRPQAFSCIAYFDSGNIDVHPHHVENVMAYSSGNSIFLARQLLEDPAIIGFEREVTRIDGNVGQVGSTFMVPPKKPKIKSIDESSWRVISHSNFDGTAEDCFGATSCHISFTNYRLPITLANHDHGRQDVVAYFIETVVSVYDSGEWVADLDILATLSSCDLYRVRCSPRCGGNNASPSEHYIRQLVCVDRWEEILERPEHGMVVRAHGNWLARLAMTSFAIGRGCKVIVLAEPGCWSCSKDQYGPLISKEVFII